jgi:hypothetical protein
VKKAEKKREYQSSLLEAQLFGSALMGRSSFRFCRSQKRFSGIRKLQISLIIFHLVNAPLLAQWTPAIPSGMGSMVTSGMTSPYGYSPSYSNSGYGFSGRGMSPMAIGGMTGGMPGMGSYMPYMGTTAPIGSFNSGVNMGPSAMFGGSLLSSMNQTMGLAQQVGQNLLLAEYQIKSKGDPPLQRQDDFFPRCKTAIAQESKPSQSACAPNSIRDPMTEMKTIQVMKRAELMSHNYEKVTLQGTEQKTSFGTQCVKNEAQKLYDDMHAKQENLKRKISQINEATAQAKQQLQDQLLKMANINKELDGVQGTGTRADASRDFRKTFNTPSCQRALDLGALNSGGGLYSVRNQLQQSQQKAQTVQSLPRTTLERMITQDINKISKQVHKDVAPATGLNFPIAAQIYGGQWQEKAAEFKQVQDRITKVAGQGIDLGMDLNDFERFKSQNLPSRDYIKKVLVESCMGKDSSEVLSYKAIMGGLKHVDNQGHLNNTFSLQQYKAKLQSILNNRGYNTQEKIKRVKLLESKQQGDWFKAPVGQLYKKEEQNRYWKVSTILESNQRFCEDRLLYEEHSTAYGTGKSVMDIINEAFDDLEKLKKQVDNRGTDMAQVIRDRILSCEGIPAALTPADCSQRLDLKSENFCMQQAKSCSQDILSCLNSADKIIQRKEGQVKKMAKEYNWMVSQVINKHNQQLKGLVQSIQKDAAALNKLIPGGRFQFGGANAESLNLFIANPAMGDQQYKVPLLGNGNLNFLDGIGNKLAQVAQAMQQQEQQVKQMVDKKVGEMTAQYNKEKQFWDQLFQKCQQTVTQYQQMKGMRNMQQAQYRQQMMQKYFRFCNQLQFAQVMPGCEGRAQMLNDQLAEIMPMIGMGPEMMKLQEYNRLCNQLSNSLNQQTTTPDPLLQMGNNPEGMSYTNICKQVGFQTGEIFNRFSAVVKKNNWQVAAVLSNRYGAQVSQDQIPVLISGTKFNGGNYTFAGIPSSQLTQTQTGSFIHNLLELGEILNQKIPLNDGSGQSVNFCDFVASKKRRVGQIIDGTAKPSEVENDQLLKRCDIGRSAGGAMLMASGGGEGQGFNADAISQCVDGLINLSLTSNTSGISRIAGKISSLSTMQNDIIPELTQYTSKNMGEVPNMQCAAQFNMPKPFYPPNMAGGGAMGGAGAVQSVGRW